MWIGGLCVPALELRLIVDVPSPFELYHWIIVQDHASGERGQYAPIHKVWNTTEATQPNLFTSNMMGIATSVLLFSNHVNAVIP